MRLLPILALAALLPACATVPPPGDMIHPAAFEGRPLRARIVNGNGHLMVNTSRPAHVAIFEIVPGQGVGLLYPAYRGESNYLSAGLNTIFLSRSRSYYTYFQPSAGFRGPRYLYMIASDAPLRLSTLTGPGAGGALRRSLGMARFASSNPYSLMEDLSDMILSFGAPGDWTEDVYVIWPEHTYGTGDYRAADWVRVQCGDGRVIEGPTFYVYGGCAHNPAPPVKGNPEQPDDSTAVKPPTRRRPEPVEPVTEADQRTARPPKVEAIPEPTLRPRGWTREGSGSSRFTDTGGARRPESAQVERRVAPETRGRPGSSGEGRQEPRVERRQEPRSEPRFEPRSAPQIERRPESQGESRPSPRSEAPPRVEARSTGESSGQ